MKWIIASCLGLVFLIMFSITQAGPKLQHAFIEKPYDNWIQQLNNDHNELNFIIDADKAPFIEIGSSSVSRAKIVCGAFTVPVTEASNDKDIEAIINFKLDVKNSSEYGICLFKFNNLGESRFFGQFTNTRIMIPMSMSISRSANNFGVAWSLECRDYGTSSGYLSMRMDSINIKVQDLDVHPTSNK